MLRGQPPTLSEEKTIASSIEYDVICYADSPTFKSSPMRACTRALLLVHRTKSVIPCIDRDVAFSHYHLGSLSTYLFNTNLWLHKRHPHYKLTAEAVRAYAREQATAQLLNALQPLCPGYDLTPLKSALFEMRKRIPAYESKTNTIVANYGARRHQFNRIFTHTLSPMFIMQLMAYSLLSSSSMKALVQLCQRLSPALISQLPGEIAFYHHNILMGQANCPDFMDITTLPSPSLNTKFIVVTTSAMQSITAYFPTSFISWYPSLPACFQFQGRNYFRTLAVSESTLSFAIHPYTQALSTLSRFNKLTLTPLILAMKSIHYLYKGRVEKSALLFAVLILYLRAYAPDLLSEQIDIPSEPVYSLGLHFVLLKFNIDSLLQYVVTPIISGLSLLPSYCWQRAQQHAEIQSLAQNAKREVATLLQQHGTFRHETNVRGQATATTIEEKDSDPRPRRSWAIRLCRSFCYGW